MNYYEPLFSKMQKKTYKKCEQINTARTQTHEYLRVYSI